MSTGIQIKSIYRQTVYLEIMDELKKIPPGKHQPLPEFLFERYGYSDIRKLSLADVINFLQYLRRFNSIRTPG